MREVDILRAEIQKWINLVQLQEKEMENLKRAAKITYRRIEDFFDQAQTLNIKKVYRKWGHQDDSDTALYTAWDGGGIFLIANIVFPELQRLKQILPYRRHGRPWEVSHDGRMMIHPDNKTDFLKALKILGVSDEARKEFRKLTLENIQGLINEDSEDENRETRYSRDGTLHRTLYCDAIDGIVNNLDISITLKERHDATYYIFLGEWRDISLVLQNKHEGRFREADIKVIPGEVDLV